jgi:outer membrane receptor protein involved in Fe transport
VSTVKIKGELEFVKSAHISLALNGTYTHYKTNQEYAWYKPAYEFGFTGRYDMQNKIVITTKVVVNGPVWASVPVHDPLFDGMGPAPYVFISEKLKGWTDLNLGAEYRFTKALSFWLNFNNLTNNKYYRWNNYRSYGINLLGGVSYSF